MKRILFPQNRRKCIRDTTTYDISDNCLTTLVDSKSSKSPELASSRQITSHWKENKHNTHEILQDLTTNLSHKQKIWITTTYDSR